VLAGVVFAGEARSASSVGYALLTFLAFCLLSGAVYAFNDVLDVEEDRKHPLKRLRPVASGEVPMPVAVAFSALLVIVGLALCFFVNVGVGAAGVAYLVLQAVYTPVLKHIAILDVMSISAGFVIRALAGVAAVAAPISPACSRSSSASPSAATRSRRWVMAPSSTARTCGTTPCHCWMR
jgi:4-hydroxybenzoate polyprenyltransferase